METNIDDVDTEPVKPGPGRNSVSLLIKVGLFSLFLIGLLMRIFIPIENFLHLSTLLMWVAVLGRLFLYVRGLNPSVFLPKQDNSSPLRLVDKRDTIVPTYDRRELTPLERIISDK